MPDSESPLEYYHRVEVQIRGLLDRLEALHERIAASIVRAREAIADAESVIARHNDSVTGHDVAAKQKKCPATKG